MRTLVKFQKDRSYIAIKTVKLEPDNAFRWRGKSDRFYIHCSLIDKALYSEKEVIARDGYNFVSLIHNKKSSILNISITWVKPHNPHNYPFITAIENLRIDSRKFKSWFTYCNNESIYSQLSLLEKRSNKVIFIDSALPRLKEVLANKLVRKKFIKILMNSFTSRGRDVTFYSDFVPYSFFWQEEGGYHGGLILHNHNNLSEASYGIHT